MNRIVVDIETLAYPIGQFDEQQREYLLKFAKTEEERMETIQKMSLNPFTAHTIAIGMLNPDSDQGKVLYDAPTGEPRFSADGRVEFIACQEHQMLEEFWKTISHYNQFITFNGRSFDGPFLLLRSTMLGIRPTKNLLPNRYYVNEHCDLLDQLTFYGAIRRFNLDFYCKSFGIKSPKSGGITGLDLGGLYSEGRFFEIADYCLGDVRATADLYQRWRSYLLFEK